MFYEASSIAGNLGLNKLIVFYDSNNVTLDGALKTSFDENIKERFESMNWNYILVSDSEDLDSINEAIEKAKSDTNDKPTLIEIKTTIGKYSKNQGTSLVHGSPLDEEDIVSIKNTLGLREVPFAISLEAKDAMRERICERNKDCITAWNEKTLSMDENLRRDFDLYMNNKLPVKISNINYVYPTDGKDSTRNVSGKIINSVAETYPFLLGGSADVSKSTMARINNTLDFSASTPNGRNINFGVRENAMASIANGMALSNITPFVSTFFAFSDFLKPGIRLSALMDLPVIYVFSHDSISVGEDGPTHEPVEQLAALRCMPNFDVYRPADANETIGAYKAVLELRKPAAIVLGRNKVTIDENTSSSDVIKGAYIVRKEKKDLEAVIISSGDDALLEKGYSVRVVSMPSMSRFEKNEESYKREILPASVKTFVIEASSSISWYKYVKNDDYLFTIDTFGASGKRDDILRKYGFTVNKITKDIEKLLK